MRLAICGLFLFILLPSCKTLNGDYYESFGHGWGGADYEFHKDGTFKYSSHYDVGGEYGNGSYSIRFGRLKLHFETAVTESYVSVWYCFARRDSSEPKNAFHILIRDENKEPIPFAVIKYSQPGDTSMHGFVSDIDGYGQMILSDRTDSLLIEIRTVGYEVFKKDIAVNSFDSITVFLFPNPRSGQVAVESGSVWTYNLRSVDQNEIILVDRRIEMVEVGDGYSYKRVRHRDLKKLVKKKR